MHNVLDLLVVVINYKTPQLTIDCLKAVIPQLGLRQEVVVVDNFSDDGSIEYIAKWLEGEPALPVSIIRSSLNTGFSGGNNMGICSKAADFYLLLNSDALLRDGALEVLLKTAKESPDVGIVSPRLEWPNGEGQISCFRYHNAISEFILAASTGPVTKMLERWDVPCSLDGNKSYPEWTSFACVLLRGEAIKNVGLMDEGYFLYYEDADYCKMLRGKGWKVLNNPDAHVVHLRGGSSDVKKNFTRRARVPRYYYASRTRYFRKHYGVFGHVIANLAWMGGRVISILRELLTKRETSASEKQWRDIWINVFRPLRPYLEIKNESK